MIVSWTQLYPAEEAQLAERELRSDACWLARLTKGEEGLLALLAACRKCESWQSPNRMIECGGVTIAWRKPFDSYLLDELQQLAEH